MWLGLFSAGSRARIERRIAFLGCICASVVFLQDLAPSPALAQSAPYPPGTKQPTAPGAPGLPSELFSDYMKAQTALDQLLRKPCVTAAERKTVLDSTRSWIEYLLKYAKSSTKTDIAAQEANDYASILNSKYLLVQQKKECPPGTPGIPSTPSTPGMTTPPATPGTTTPPTETTDSKCEELNKEYVKVLDEIGKLGVQVATLEGDRNVANGEKNKAEVTLEYLEDFKKNPKAYADEYKQAKDKYDKYVEEQKKKGEEPWIGPFIMPKLSDSNIQAVEKDAKAALDKANLDLQRIDGLLKGLPELQQKAQERLNKVSEQLDEIKKCKDKILETPVKTPIEHGKSTDGKKRRKKDDTKQGTTGDSPPGISFDIGIGGGRGREREHRRDRKKDERRRDEGGRGGFGISPGITFGR